MDEASQDRHSLFMLISLVVFLVLSAFLTERNVLGEGILLLSMYVTLVAGTLQLSQEKAWRWPGLLLAACSMLTMLFFWIYFRGAVLLFGKAWFDHQRPLVCIGKSLRHPGNLFLYALQPG